MMAKGDTKNVDANRSVGAQDSIRRSAKARRKHTAGTGAQAPTSHIFAEINRERRERSMELREMWATQQAQHKENIQLQSGLAQVFITQWTMRANERLIAQAVAKSFADSAKSGSMSRTAVAKDKVRKVWEKNPALQARVSKQELEKGLRIGGAALNQAGKEVFDKAPAVES